MFMHVYTVNTYSTPNLKYDTIHTHSTKRTYEAHTRLAMTIPGASAERLGQRISKTAKSLPGSCGRMENKGFQGLGVSGFRVKGLGFRVWDLGFRVVF